MKDHEYLSIVVPVFNEEDNLLPLHAALCRELEPLEFPFEIIFVNDGSRDRSQEILAELCGRDQRVRAISLSRNFGHQAAITAGCEHAAGDAVVVMDADLQHPPELIPKMIDFWRQGYQVVYTLRESSSDVGLFKRFTSAAFYKCINAVSEVQIIPNAADFRLMDRAVVDCLVSMPERSRFLRGMVSWVGFRQIGLPYMAQPRFAGKSKYSVRKMLNLAVHGLTSFSSIPLRLSAYIGFVAAVVGIPYGIWAVYARLFTEQAVPGWASLVVMVLFLGGVQLMSLGIIGEYVGRIYTEVKGRPLYIAAQKIGFRQAATLPLADDRNDVRAAVQPARRAS